MFNATSLPPLFYPNYTPLPFGQNPPPSSNPTINSIDYFLQMAQRWPQVPTRQFVQRFLPAYLNYTSFEGSWSSHSITYWQQWIQLWLTGQALFFPLNIDKSIFDELREVLTDFQNSIDITESTSGCQESATQLHLNIQQQLKSRGYTYISLGYKEGPLNHGHSIPLRIDYDKTSDKIIIHFLNLGEGSQLHPHIEWDENYPRQHFRSFPISFSSRDFFGPLGIDLMAREISLIQGSAPGSGQPYSTYDVYGAFAVLGETKGDFASTASLRSKKTQINNTCADKAIELLIRDFLIEKKVPKREISRLFCNEKLCTLLRFYHTLSGSQDKSHWVLFKKGLQEFSLLVLKKNKESLSNDEAFICKELLTIFFAYHQEGESKCAIKSDLRILPEDFLNNTTFSFAERRQKNETTKIKPTHILLTRESEFTPLSQDKTVLPKEFFSWLENLRTSLQSLKNGDNLKRECALLENAINQTPIPLCSKDPFWDHIPEGDITKILKTLAQLTANHLNHSHEASKYTFHKKALLLHTIYAISDKLIRRIHPEMTTFGAPFALIHAGEQLEFPLLHQGHMNARWKEVKNYFISVNHDCKHTLFAFHEKQSSLNLFPALKQLQQNPDTPHPINSHLKFLAQFLDKNPTLNDLPFIERYALLWENEGCRYLPEDFYHYQYVAQSCWSCYTFSGDDLPSFGKPLCQISMGEDEESLDLFIIYPHAKKNSFDLSRGAIKTSTATLSTSILDKSATSTENEPFCLPITPGSSQHETEWKRDWLRISVHPQLQVTSTLQWVLNHLTSVRDVLIKDQIEKKLFASGALLIEKIKQEPHLALRLRQMIAEGIKFYGDQPNETPQFLFFIRLGILIETHIERAGNTPLSSELCHIYEKRLLNRIHIEKDPLSLRALYSHLLFLYSVTPPYQATSIKELLRASFWLAYTEKSEQATPSLIPHWMQAEIDHLEDKWNGYLCTLQLYPMHLNQTCYEILQLLQPHIQLPEIPWQGCYPTYSCGEYSINLREKTLYRKYKKEQLHLFQGSFISHSHLPKEVQKTLKNNGNRLWVGESGFTSEDNTHRLLSKKTKREHHLVFEQQIRSEEGIFWYRQAVSTPHPTISKLAASVEGDLWQRSDGKGDLLIIERDTGVPRYAIRHTPQGGECIKLNPRGRALGERLINLEHNPIPFFERLGLNPEETFCWIDEKGSLASVELTTLKLQFKSEWRGSKLILHCQNFPSFYIAKQQIIPELKTFKGALVLENEKNEKRIIIPSRSIKREAQDFSLEISLSTSPLSRTLEPYYTFYLDENRGTLLHEEPEGNLLLAMIFAALNEYEEALYYLDKGHTFSYTSDFFENFSKLRDESPEALAFYLRVGLHIFENFSQIIKEGYGSQGAKLKKTHFASWLSTIYVDYLRYASTVYSRIPAYIKLTEKEELMLLEGLEKENALPYLLAFRKNLLMNQTVRAAERPKAYDLLPKNCKHVIPLSIESFKRDKLGTIQPVAHFNPYFVRMSADEVQHYFPQLYQRALTHQGALDIYYLMRSSTIDSDARLLSAYSTLLRIIRASPAAFSKYQFNDNITKNSEVFRKIVKKAQKIQGKIQLEKTDKMYHATVQFNNTSSKILKLPTPSKLAPMKWRFQEGSGENLSSLHRSLHEQFLLIWVDIKRPSAIEDRRPFLFEHIPHTLCVTPTFKRIVEAFKLGYRLGIQPGEGPDRFTLKNIKTIKECEGATEKLLNEKKQHVRRVRAEVEKRANYIPPHMFTPHLEQRGRALPNISVEGILTQAAESKNLNLIRQANPSLSETEIRNLLVLTLNYHILNCHIHQLTRGIAALKKGDIQTFGECLAVYETPSPIEDPTLLIFQSRSQMSVRKEQSAFIKWLRNAPHTDPHRTLLFEMKAGGGKGSFISIILWLEALKRGEVPIGVSPATLYQPERKKQSSSLKKASRLNLEVLEIALNTRATAADFKWVFEKLTTFSEATALKITPEVYYALELKYQYALETEEVEKVRYLSLILHFFKKQCTAFIDEGRLNLSPLTQAKIGIGAQLPLPDCDHKLFIHLYKALLNPKHCLNDGRAICKVLQLDSNKQAMVNPKDNEEIRQFLIKYMLNYKDLGIPEAIPKEIQLWWSDPTAPKPQWLLDEEERGTQRARLITLTGEFFHHFYFFAMKSVGNMRHRRSEKPGEEIELTAHKRQPTSNYFEEPYVALFLTIHGTLQRGLDKGQCAKLIDLVKERCEIESLTITPSPIEKTFERWVGSQELPLTHLSSKNSGHIDTVHALLSKHPEAIFWYLENSVLKQITYSSEQLIATPQHFLNAFKERTIYSAFLGPSEIYGVYPTKKKGEDAARSYDSMVRTDMAFAAQVVHTLTEKRHSSLITFDTMTDSPLDVLRHLWKQDPKLFNSLRMIIDTGKFRDYSNEEIAHAFFAFLKELKDQAPPFDGVIFFQESSGREDEGDMMIWLKGWDKPKILPEGEVVSGLAKLGYRWEELALFSVIDPSHAVGSDILQIKEASALLLLGENLTLGDWIQAVMRMREVLNKQTIIWGIDQLLAQMIEHEVGLPCTPEAILLWSLKNESELQDMELSLSIYQQIDYAVQIPARHALEAALNEPKKQIQLWKKYRSGFVRRFDNDPIKRFKNQGENKKTLNVISLYAKKEYEKFNYDTPWPQATLVRDQLKPTVRAAVKKSETSSTRPVRALSSQTHMQCQQQQHLKTDQEKILHFELEADEMGPIGHLDLGHKYLINDLTSPSFAATPISIFQTNYFSKNLFLSHRLLRTAKSGGKSLNHTYLKPTQYLLIIQEKNHRYAFAISDAEADFFQQKLTQQTRIENRTVALFTADGCLAQNGSGEIHFTNETLQELTGSTWFQDVVNDLALLNCRIRDTNRFLKRAQQVTEFPALWNKIKTWQIHLDLQNAHLIDRMVAKITQPTKKSPSSKLK